MTIVVVSGTRGAGKSTVARQLVRAVPGAQLVRAVTTRPPRPDDVGGAYEFVDAATFNGQSFLMSTAYASYRYAVREADVLGIVATGALAVMTLAPQLLTELSNLRRLGAAVTVFLDHEDAILDQRLGTRSEPAAAEAHVAQRVLDRSFADLAERRMRADDPEVAAAEILRTCPPTNQM